MVCWNGLRAPPSRKGCCCGSILTAVFCSTPLFETLPGACAESGGYFDNGITHTRLILCDFPSRVPGDALPVQLASDEMAAEHAVEMRQGFTGGGQHHGQVDFAAKQHREAIHHPSGLGQVGVEAIELAFVGLDQA